MPEIQKYPFEESDLIFDFKRLSPIWAALLAPEGTLQKVPSIGFKSEERFKIHPSERTPIHRASKSVAYEGPWYYQAYNPTCTAWAVANTGLVFGLKPDMLCITQLSEMAKAGEFGQGLDISKAVEVVNRNTHMPYELVNLNGVDKREFYPDASLWDSINNFSNKKYLIESRHYENEKNRHSIHVPRPLDEVFATQVIDHIDRHSPILMAVNSREYSGSDTEDSHAICLSGYRIDQNGFMDFQVVDSAQGIIWVPKERIERASIVGSKFIGPHFMPKPKIQLANIFFNTTHPKLTEKLFN